MNKKVVKIVLKIYLFIRVRLSPRIFKKYYALEDYIPKWDKYKDLSMEDFSREINKFPYKWDKLKGALDCSFNPKNPDHFFQVLDVGRDCDDFARVWRVWAEHNNYEAFEYVFTNKDKPFGKAHVVAIIKKEDKYWLLNYTPFGPCDSLEEAIMKMAKWYVYENMVYVRYHFEKEKY